MKIHEPAAANDAHATGVGAPASEQGRHVSPWIVFTVASSAVILVSIDGTMLFSVFGSLRASFPQSTAAEMSWVINAYTIVYAATLIPAGGVADAYGRKRVFLIGVAVFVASSGVCGLASNVPVLVAARAIQAIGAALLTPASLSIVLAAFPQSKRALTVSTWGAVGGFAAAIGPSLGSFITQTIGWPWAFFINLPVGALSLWFGARLLPQLPRGVTRSKIDLIGMALLIVSVGALALVIVEADSSTWTAGELCAVAVLSAVAAGGFIIWAKKAADPLIDLELFRNPTYSAVNAATVTFGIAFSIMFFAFFFYMTNVWHFDQEHAGLAIAPGPLTVVPAAIITGRLAGRYGHRPFLVGGSLLYAASGLSFMLLPGDEPAYLTRWLPGLFLSGAAVGLVMPSLSGAAVSRLPVDRYALGSAINQAARQVGGSIGVAITVMLLGHNAVHRVDFNAVYSLHVALALVTAGLCTLVHTRPR
jgi:EmrB/QacA subfamily drug resistance transporter